MILLIPILLYVILIIGMIGVVRLSLNTRTEAFQKKVVRWIKATAIILFFPLGLLYLSYLFGLALQDHYNVEKGSFLWYATMDNETITEFPLIEVAGPITYNSIGGDSPNIGTGWEIAYTSQAASENLTHEIMEYLEDEGYSIEEVEETQFYWSGKNKKSEANQLYSGSNEKGESLDLSIQKLGSGLSRIECSIVY